MRNRALFIVLGTAASLAGQDTLHLTLQEAEKIAVQNNPQVSAARYNAEASKEVPKELRSNYQPTVFGSLTGVGAADGSRIAAGALNNPIIYNRFASGIGVSQFITDFGRTANLVGSAQSRSLAEQERANATRADVLLNVCVTYFSVLRAQAVLTVAQQTVSARQLVADQITALAQNGLKSNLDVSFANVNLADAKLLLASAGNDVRASRAALANAIGYPNQQNFALNDEPMPDPPPAEFKALIAEAIRNRPELASLRFEQEAAARFAKAERDLWMPSVSTIAAIGLVPTGAATLQSQYGAVGVNVNIPLFNGGLFKARHTEAELRAKTAQENVSDLQNRVVRDVQVAYLNAVTGYERLSLTQRLLEHSSLAQDLAQSRYNLGLGSIVELSQAQLNLTSAQIAVTNGRYDYQTQWSTLQYQIGALR
jgi:outer membrane protein